MQPAGVFVMVASVGTVATLFLWCVWKVLSQPPAEMDHLHGVDFQTPDVEAD